jgi:hypothetical protein
MIFGRYLAEEERRRQSKRISVGLRKSTVVPIPVGLRKSTAVPGSIQSGGNIQSGGTGEPKDTNSERKPSNGIPSKITLRDLQQSESVAREKITLRDLQQSESVAREGLGREGLGREGLARENSLGRLSPRESDSESKIDNGRVSIAEHVHDHRGETVDGARMQHVDRGETVDGVRMQHVNHSHVNQNDVDRELEEGFDNHRETVTLTSGFVLTKTPSSSPRLSSPGSPESSFSALRSRSNSPVYSRSVSPSSDNGSNGGGIPRWMQAQSRMRTVFLLGHAGLKRG